GLLPDGTSGNPGDGRSGDPVANRAGSRSDRAVRAGAVGVPCELGLRSSILMKQKNMLPVKTLLKNLPRKTGGGQGFLSGVVDIELDGSWGYINRSGGRHAT